MNIPDYRKMPNGGVNSPRQSNMEALRIVAMLLVLLTHFAQIHCVPSPQGLASDTFATIVNLCLRSLSYVCVNCFILISGYFGIRWRVRSFANLLFQIFFWIIFGVAVAAALDFGFNGSVSGACLSMLNGRWFIPAYISLYIMAPVINAFVEKATTKELLAYLLSFYAFSTFFGYFMFSQEFNEGMSLISLIGIYLTGAYLRRGDMVLYKWKVRRSFIAYFLLGLLLVVMSIVALEMGISSSLYGYLNPVIILQSVFLFLFFRGINIGRRKWINYVAASAFSVYLFHMHPLVYGKYKEICHWLIDETVPALTLPILFAAIFAFCTLVDHFRLAVFSGACRLFKI